MAQTEMDKKMEQIGRQMYEALLASEIAIKSGDETGYNYRIGILTGLINAVNVMDGYGLGHKMYDTAMSQIRFLKANGGI